MDQRIIRIGTVELTETEAARLYAAGKYLVCYRTIWAIRYSQAQARFYGSCVYRMPKAEASGFSRRGRFHAMVADDVNRLLGFRLLTD